MQYYFGITFDKQYKISHRFYLYDGYSNVIYCGDDLVKDISFNSTFNYFKKINKIHFPINKEKFEEFLLLSWPLLENSCFLRFVEIHTIEEWIV